MHRSGAQVTAATTLRDLLPGSAYRRSGTTILLTAITGPVWNVIVLPVPGVSLTIGRLLIALSALLLVIDLCRASGPRPAVPRAVWLLLAALGALWTWTAMNLMVWGCRCAGEFAGLSELLAIAALAAFAATFEPRLRPAMIIAVVAGSSLSAALALGGVTGLTEGTRNEATIQGRLAGPYGNPNYLGFALAFAVPALLAAYRLYTARARLLLLAALGLVGLALLLTFSRGSLIAALAGAAVVLVLQRSRGRERWRMVGGLVITLAVAALAYPVFSDLRREASRPDLDATLRALDLSGWDGRVQGLIASGPSTLVNPSPEVLEIQLSEPDQGVSRAIGTATAGGTYELRFEARTVSGSQRLSFGLEDNVLGNGPAARAVALDEQWRALRVSWSPSGYSPDARFYISGAATTVGFQIRNVVTTLHPQGGRPLREPLSVRLQGSDYARLEAGLRKAEKRDIASRLAGIMLSWEAFASQPIRGIGWGRFNVLADARTEFGRLPTHNEYLRFLAELGAVGMLPLLLVVAVITAAVRRARRDALGLALLGMLITGGIGLLFINGLVASAVAMPLAFAAAAACARSGRRAALPAGEASSWWPVLPPRPEAISAWALLRSLAQHGFVSARAASPSLGVLRLRVSDLSARVITQLRRRAPEPLPATTTDVHRLRRRGAEVRWRGSRLRWALGMGVLRMLARLPGLVLATRPYAPAVRPLPKSVPVALGSEADRHSRSAASWPLTGAPPLGAPPASHGEAAAVLARTTSPNASLLSAPTWLAEEPSQRLPRPSSRSAREPNHRFLRTLRSAAPGSKRVRRE